jgi:hypothetical protein
MACNACKRRKVGCSGDPTCRQCLKINLPCVYSSPDSSSRSRSRKAIKRGGVIEAYKRDLPADSPPNSLVFLTSSSSPKARSDFFVGVLQNVDFAYYSAYIYPFRPIVSESEFRSAATNATTSKNDAALAYALAALTLNAQPDTPTDSGQVEVLYEKALELRGVVMPQHHATAIDAMVPLAAASLCCEKYPEMAFYYLREAITIAVLLRVGEEDSNDVESNVALDLEEKARRQ